MNREPEHRDESRTDGLERATLRLLGEPRAGLEERMLARLKQQPMRQAWLRPRTQLAAGAACAALLAWGVHAGLHGGRARQGTATTVRQEPAQPEAQPAAARAAGSFGTAGSMRVPPTLKPLYVPAPPRRNAGAGKPAASRAKHAGQTAPAPDGTAAPMPTKPSTTQPR